MDKYNSKTTFQKWFSAINLNDLSILTVKNWTSRLLDRLHNDGYFFVTRTKSNTTITVLEQMELVNRKTTDGQIISDQHVILGSGNNHITERFRLVTVLTKGQRLLRIVTNRFDVSPNEVADMYQARWQIELFFKHLKQNLTINQVILTLIATLLIYLVKIELNSTATLFQLKRSFHYLRFESAKIWLERHRPG